MLFVLSLSFFIAFILTHYFSNYFTRAIYYLSSIWLWFASNLFFIFLFFILSVSILNIFNISFDIKLGWIIVILFAFLITWYWLYNANNLVTKNVDIKLKNIPELWTNKKVVLLSDVHIWAIIWKDFINKISKIINNQNPDLVFITWDLFDWTDWDLEHIAPYINQINSKQWIYYINWNHEIYLWNDLCKNILKNTKVKILDDELINIDWVQILGLSFFDSRYWKQNIKDKLSRITNVDKTKPSILLYHAPMNIEEFKSFWINLQLSWHTHKGQFFPFWYITKLLYGWKDYWLYKYWDYNLYTTSWVWTWWPPLRFWSDSEIVVLNFK